jgi:uncharacterized protein
MAGLALIGAAHAFLIWWGDILLNYALVGLLIFPFHDRPQSVVLRWALMLYWLPLLLLLGLEVVSTDRAASMVNAPENIQRTIQIYTEGTWRDMLHERLREWKQFNQSAPLHALRLLGLFLLGMYVWRTGVVQNLGAHLPAIRRIAKWALPAGLAGSIFSVLVHHRLASAAASSIGVPALSLSYACGVILLYHRQSWQPRLMLFAAIGRMALTNYLLESLLCTSLFYGYGLGLFGTIGPLLGLPITVAIYAGQVAFSELWLRRFRFGPAEWLWRVITYGYSPLVRQHR